MADRRLQVFHAVAAGLGYAIMSRATVDKEKRLGERVALPLSPKMMRSLSLVFPKEEFHSRLVNTFIEFAKQKLQNPGR
jgi:DNA-binding transcriptional LysR family regulator